MQHSCLVSSCQLLFVLAAECLGYASTPSLVHQNWVLQLSMGVNTAVSVVKMEKVKQVKMLSVTAVQQIKITNKIKQPGIYAASISLLLVIYNLSDQVLRLSLIFYPGIIDENLYH